MSASSIVDRVRKLLAKLLSVCWKRHELVLATLSYFVPGYYKAHWLACYHRPSLSPLTLQTGLQNKNAALVFAYEALINRHRYR